jgi:hypothetical protein
VTADQDITLYGGQFVPAETDLYLALPVSALGTDYVVPAYGYSEGPSEAGIVATQEQTTVTIRTTADIEGPPSRPAPVPFTVLLNRLDAFQLKSLSGLPPEASDFTGTVVTSDKPIAVFGWSPLSVRASPTRRRSQPAIS